MNAPNSLRLTVIAAALLGAVFVGIRDQSSTQPIDRALPTVEFPHEPAVAGWQAIVEDVVPIRPHTQRYRRTASEDGMGLELQFIPDLPVHYVRNPLLELRFLPRGHLPLDAGMQFYVSPRAKAVPNQRSGSARDTNVIAGPDGTGFWVVDETAHLSTVIAPSGQGAIVPSELARRMYLDPVTIGRLAGWLFTSEPLPDRRCVLIHFSMPDGPGARAALEQAWNDWRAVYRPVFPGAAR